MRNKKRVLSKAACTLCAAMMLFSATACNTGSGKGDILKQFNGLPTLRLSSVYAVEDGSYCKFKMRAPFTDTYFVRFNEKGASAVDVYDEEGNVLASESKSFDLQLEKDQLVYLRVKPSAGKVGVKIKSKENRDLLPFSLGEAPDVSKLSTTSEDPTVDPLRPAQLNYKKRADTLYVYCNAPESISVKPSVINHCITRQPVGNQEVFFTFEHNSIDLEPGVFYGYRVRNTGSEDMYVTVKNIGCQFTGVGSWLGESEWTDFYNTKFELPDMSGLTDSQKKNWEAYIGFSGLYDSPNYQPEIYRVPAGEYMYVIGGTTADAFGGFNVNGTANHRMSGDCQNGAVLFEVLGEAEGSYYIYNDYTKIKPGTEGGDAHLGITDPALYGVVHTGDDVGIVVDNCASWTFNDATPTQQLPVTYTNYYKDDLEVPGTPGEEIPSTPHVQERTSWATHINVQNTHEGVGTDMTSFHTLGPDGKPVIVGVGWYDTRGRLANIGNWMKDYQDVYTFTNQGDRERTVEVNVTAKGGIAAMVRNMDGTIVRGTEKFYTYYNSTDYGDEFNLCFKYTVKVPAHTTKQFVVEYNLMANSYGYVNHFVNLT